MDATVDDFFNEINEIAPTKAPKKPEVWQECYDKLTGYSYYWNTKTDEVTWTTPSSYTPASEPKKIEKPNVKKKIEPFNALPKKGPPPLPQPTKLPESSIKIYSVQQNSQPVTKSAGTAPSNKSRKYPSKRRHSDSEDEKIELITSYGGDSDSDTDNEPPKVDISQENVESDDDDNADLLKTIHERAKELQKLEKQSNKDNVVKPSTEVSGFSLVAGYASDSESETEPDEVKPEPLFQATIKTETPTSTISHSTLFPIAQPVDIKDFEPTPDTTPKEASISPVQSNFDSKAFQRKRRIGISLVNNAKKPKDSVAEEVNEEKKGFGFSSEDSSDVKKTLYSGFQKGGVLFNKAEDIYTKEETSKTSVSLVVDSEEQKIDKSEVQDNYSVLKEKLSFLTEGHEAVLPVQVMLIQANTLFVAMQENGLKLSYLQKWLSDTCSELIKLEKEAAPEGWLLQWDRLNKRYYYQNQSTGASQWEYPQQPAVPAPAPPEEEESKEVPMDICMTPPHPDPEPMAPPSPPLPPVIRHPTPPPPPIITREDIRGPAIPDAPLPPSPPPPSTPPPPPPPVMVNNGEPLPPGVDLPEINTFNNTKEKESEKAGDSLISALDSFYSEIATELTSSPNSQDAVVEPTSQLDLQTSQINTELAKKKKKSKVKLAAGISMKKKGVSQLVEKWKNVHKNFGD